MTEPLNLLVLGATGRLGRAMVRRYSIAGLAVKALSRTELDFESPDQLGAALAKHEFNVLINTAGLTDVDYCEAHPELSQTVNADAAGALAVHCRERGARMVQISTDYAFQSMSGTRVARARSTRGQRGYDMQCAGNLTASLVPKSWPPP